MKVSKTIVGIFLPRLAPAAAWYGLAFFAHWAAAAHVQSVAGRSMEHVSTRIC